MEGKTEVQAPFSFLKPTSHSEKKATKCFGTQSRMAPFPKTTTTKKRKEEKKEPCPDKVKANREPHRMASPMAPTP